jgi:hypothetical protein
VGFIARENWRSFTLVLSCVWLASAVSARATALAMAAASRGFADVADTATIGASGDVSARTLLWSFFTGTRACTWASPSTAIWVATRP